MFHNRRLYQGLCASACAAVLSLSHDAHAQTAPSPQNLPAIQGIAVSPQTPVKGLSRFGLETRHPNDGLITRTGRPIRISALCPDRRGNDSDDVPATITGTLTTFSTLTVTGRCFGRRAWAVRLLTSTPMPSDPNNPYGLAFVAHVPVKTWTPNRIEFFIPEFDRSKLAISPPSQLVLVLFVDGGLIGASASLSPDEVARLQAGETLTNLTTIQK
jgi:hypothetical protein